MNTTRTIELRVLITSTDHRAEMDERIEAEVSRALTLIFGERCYVEQAVSR